MIRDIPEDAEAIDVCKAVEEMINESEERGELRMLVKQVRKGRITIEQAAEDANMSVEQFKRVIDEDFIALHIIAILNICMIMGLWG